MFKFNHQQALTGQPLGSGQESAVYPYLEGQDDSTWVVKCIKINDPDKINSLLQNILTTTSANSDSVVPIKGHDIHRDDQGGATVYLKMPRMKQSLKDLIQYYRANQQLKMPLEQLVHCFHSVASCLDELAQKEIAHRNLKPSNVLIDRDGHVYLSDIQMIETVGQGRETKEMETTGGYDEDSIYKAPETFYDHWAKDGEDLHKADAWSMGMVIAKACLIDRLIPTSPELPMEENRDIIEQNLAMIAHRYGQNLAGILRRLLVLNPKERETFSTIKVLLEETFPQMNKDADGDVVDKQRHKVIDIRGEPSKVYAQISEENTIYDDDQLNERPGDNSSLLKFNSPKWIEFRRPEWFSRPDLQQGYLKGKQLVKRYAVAIVVSLVLLLLVLVSLHSSEKNNIEKQNKFVNIMTDLQIRQGNYFQINFEPEGNLEIEAIWGPTYSKEYNYHTGQLEIKSLNDEILANLMNDVTSNLASADLEDYIKWFKFILMDNHQVTDAGITQLQTSLAKMTKLEGFAIDRINGQITNFALQRLFSTLPEELKDLKNIGFSFESLQQNGTYADVQSLVATVLNNKKLTGLYFYILGPKLSENQFRGLAEMISINGQHLEALSIGFRNFDTTPSNTILKTFNSIFLSRLDSLKELALDFSYSPLTDEALSALATGVTSQKKLRRFELFLNEDEHQVLFTETGIKNLVYELSRTKIKDLKYVAIQTPSVSSDARNWLRNQLQYVPEVHITPEN